MQKKPCLQSTCARQQIINELAKFHSADSCQGAVDAAATQLLSSSASCLQPSSGLISVTIATQYAYSGQRRILLHEALCAQQHQCSLPLESCWELGASRSHVNEQTSWRWERGSLVHCAPIRAWHAVAAGSACYLACCFLVVSPIQLTGRMFPRAGGSMV